MLWQWTLDHNRSSICCRREEESPSERARLADALARVGFTDLVLFVDPNSGAAAFAARRSSDPDQVVGIPVPLHRHIIADALLLGQTQMTGFVRSTTDVRR